MASGTNIALIGGVIPALFFGVSTLLLKTSNKFGIGIGYYLIFVSLGVFLWGLCLLLQDHRQTLHVTSAVSSVAAGIFWAGGAFFMAYSLFKYNAPLSVITPIAATNSLITVILSCIIYAEWKDVSLVKVLLGTALIIGGSILIAQPK